MNKKEYFEKYPNITSVASELSKFQDPYMTTDVLLAVAKSGFNNLTSSEKNCSLTVGDILTVFNKT